MTTHWLSLLIITFLSSSITHGALIRYDIRDGAQRNLVHFTSDAALETIVGISPAVWGWVELDVEDISKGINGEFLVDSRTFLTGITGRDRILNDKVLLSQQFPTGMFRVLRVVKTRQSRLYPRKETVIDVEGLLSFRGVSRKETAEVFVTYLPASEETRSRTGGNLIKVHTIIEIELAHYGIEIPQGWEMRLSPKVKIEVNALGADRTPAKVIQIPNAS